MAFMCPHLIEQYYLKVSEILCSYKPQIILLVRYKDVSNGLVVRGVVRKEEHEFIIKMKNPKSQVEALLLIIPKRMWGLENFISVLIDQNVDLWLSEELFQAYIRHLVTSIKKQQAEKKCECLQSKDNSLLRRGYIYVLQIFDTWVYNVGTSLGFVSQTLYPVNNALAFINDRIPLPRKTAKQLQLQRAYYTDSQSVTVTEVDDDDVFEQGNPAITYPARQNNQIIGIIPRETIAKPIRAITNGLIITPLKALNVSLTRSVDCLTNLTSLNVQIADSTTNNYGTAYPMSKMNSDSLVSVKPKVMSPPFKSEHIFSQSFSKFSFSSLPGTPEENSLLQYSANSTSSPLARISQKYSLGTFNSAVKMAPCNVSTPSITSTPPKTDSISKSPTLKSTAKINPAKSSTSFTKPLSTTLKSPSSSPRLLKSSSTLAKSSPSLLKSSVSQKSSTTQSKTLPRLSKSSVTPKKSSEAIEHTSVSFEDLIFDTDCGVFEVDIEPEISELTSPNTRSVGTNTIFHHETIQQSLKSMPPISHANKAKSSSVSTAPTLNQRKSTPPTPSDPTVASTSTISQGNEKSSSYASSPDNQSSSVSSTLDEPPFILTEAIFQEYEDKSSSEASLNQNSSVSSTLNESPLVLTEATVSENQERLTSSSSILNQSSSTSVPSTVANSPVAILADLISQENKEIATTEHSSFSQSGSNEPLKQNHDDHPSSIPEIPTESIIFMTSPQLSESSEIVTSPSPNIGNENKVSGKTEENIPVSNKSPEVITKSSTLPKTSTTKSSKPTTPTGVIKRSFSSVVDRLSKPKSKTTLPEKVKSLSPTEKIAVGRNTLPKSSPIPLRKFATPSSNDRTAPGSKSESNLATSSKNAAHKKSPDSKSETNLTDDIKKSIPAKALEIKSDSSLFMGTTKIISPQASESKSESNLVSTKKTVPTKTTLSKSKMNALNDAKKTIFTKESESKSENNLIITNKITSGKSLSLKSKTSMVSDAKKIVPSTDSEAKPEINVSANLKKTVKSPAKVIPIRPKFNMSTKVAPPPPPPTYDIFNPEDFKSQQLLNEWWEKKFESPDAVSA